MNTPVIVAIVIIVVAIVLIALWFTNRQRRTRELRDRFGPEYDRAVDQYGSADRANEALAARADRVEHLQIRPLAADQSARYAESWRAVQARFVDDPERSIDEADALVADVMQTRGYPMGDFEQRAADISVDHPRVVEHYRAAHTIAQRTAQGDASTEDMRQAMVHFRTLFDELIDTPEHVEAR